MPTIPRARAVKLLTANEFRLYEQSRRGHVDDHGATRLRQLIVSARKLADKYRDLKRRQHAEARGKRRPQSKRAAETNANTLLKHEIFTDIQARFEVALERAEFREEPERPPRRAVKKVKRSQRARAAAEKAHVAAKKTARKAPRAARRKAKKAAAKKAAKSSKATAKANKATPPRAASAKLPVGKSRVRKQEKAGKLSGVAHARSRGQRKQAKRDSR
jgi:hypothetical protein